MQRDGACNGDTGLDCASFRDSATGKALFFMRGGINRDVAVFVEVQGGIRRSLQSLFYLEKP